VHVEEEKSRVFTIKVRCRERLGEVLGEGKKGVIEEELFPHTGCFERMCFSVLIVCKKG